MAGVKAGLGGVPGTEGVLVRWEAGDLGDTEGLGVAWVIAGAMLPASGDNISHLKLLVDFEGILSSMRIPLGISRFSAASPSACLPED